MLYIFDLYKLLSKTDFFNTRQVAHSKDFAYFCCC